MVLEPGGAGPRPDPHGRLPSRPAAAPGARLAHRLLPHRDGPPPGGERHADPHARNALPAHGSPAPERRPRRVGAAPSGPRDPACAGCCDLPARTDPRADAPRQSRYRSGLRTTCSGTFRGSTTRRSRTRIRSFTSSTRSTSLRAWPCGGASSRTSRTGSARACAPATCSRRSCSRARSGSSWP